MPLPAQRQRLPLGPQAPAHGGRILFVAREVDPRAVEFPPVAEAGAAIYAGARAEEGRHADRVRVDVRADRPDRAPVGDLVRPQLRQPAGRADPPPDPRDRPGRDRQFLRPGAGARPRGRPRPSRRDLQQDDGGAAPPARRADGGERPHRPPPPLHRGGAGGRVGRRHRHRRGGPHHDRQSVDRGAARRAAATRCSASRIAAVLPEVAPLIEEAKQTPPAARCSSRS